MSFIDFTLILVDNNQFLAVLSLLLLFVPSWAYICIPKSVSYYMRKGGSVGIPRDWSWHAIESHHTLIIPNMISGRLAVLRFAYAHGIRLSIWKTMLKQTIEIVLTCIYIPNPRKYVWESPFGATPCFPLGRSRLQWVTTCIKFRWLPWVADNEIRRILDANNSRFKKDDVQAPLY